MPVTIITQLARIQTDPNASENPIATAYFSKSTTVDDQVFLSPSWDSVNWELQSDKTITLNGVDYPYYLVSQLVVAIAYKEYAALSAPAPAPDPAP
jgi:hypothetical protein